MKPNSNPDLQETDPADQASPSATLLDCVPLAFLQNMWVRNPERVKASIAIRGESFRRRFMDYALFAGCVTGRRLKSAFGELCERIIWEEASREIMGAPKTIPAPDAAHIKAAIALHKPTVVLTFGRVAGDAVAALYSGTLIRAPHPAARQPDTIEKLRRAASELKALLTQSNRKVSDDAS